MARTPRVVFDRALDAIVAIDAAGTITEYNVAAERLFGYLRGEAVGRPLASTLVPESLRGAFAELAADTDPATVERLLDRPFETRARRNGGGELAIELRVTRAGTTPEQFVGFVHDLSAQHEIDRRGRASERMLARAEQLASMGSWAVDLRTRAVTWSDGLYLLQGFEPGSIAPTLETFLHLVHPDDRARIRAFVERIVDDPLSMLDADLDVAYRTVLPDGAIRELQARGRIELADGGPVRFVGSAQDITERRLAERKLHAHHAVGQALRDWESFDEGVGVLLRRLGTALGLAVGSLWVWEPHTRSLRCRAFWSADPVASTALEASTWTEMFRSGEGVPGRAWTTALPLITDDIRRDVPSHCGELALELGLRSGLAFPAVGEAGPIAVVAFYSFDRLIASDDLVSTLVGIGHELGHFLTRRRVDLGPPLLSPRELQVLQLAADGLAGPAIARHLFLSPATVKTHFGKIYDKLGVSDRAAAVAYGLRAGLLR